MVVHHINLALHAFGSFPERVQALFEIELYVVADYYYRQFQCIYSFTLPRLSPTYSVPWSAR